MVLVQPIARLLRITASWALTLSGACLLWFYGFEPAAAQSSTDRVVYLDQGWSQADRETFYQISQGSQVIAYDIFLNLEVANSQELFPVRYEQRALRTDPSGRKSTDQPGPSLDWGTYPILTFPDVPEVFIDLIDRPSEVPWGAGEPTTSVVPAAIANAVFDAAGARLRSVPFTPAKVLAAMKFSGGSSIPEEPV
jgi:hypothetical protein